MRDILVRVGVAGKTNAGNGVANPRRIRQAKGYISGEKPASPLAGRFSNRQVAAGAMRVMTDWRSHPGIGVLRGGLRQLVARNPGEVSCPARDYRDTSAASNSPTVSIRAMRDK